MANPLQEMRGLVATVALTGSVTPEFSQCMFAMGEWNRTHGLMNVEYRQEHGVLVEAARDAVVMHALKENYDWILQIDADATFPADTLGRLLDAAYIKQPDSGAVGAYSQLKPAPYLPTIDTGTGTWEEHYPGEGMLPVIRTGAHCLLVKTWVFRKMPAPWFRTRLAASPIRAFAEVDGFVRQRMDGENPLSQHPEWGTLMEAALRSASASRGRWASAMPRSARSCRSSFHP